MSLTEESWSIFSYSQLCRFNCIVSFLMMSWKSILYKMKFPAKIICKQKEKNQYWIKIILQYPGKSICTCKERWSLLNRYMKDFSLECLHYLHKSNATVFIQLIEYTVEVTSFYVRHFIFSVMCTTFLLFVFNCEDANVKNSLGRSNEWLSKIESRKSISSQLC